MDFYLPVTSFIFFFAMPLQVIGFHVALCLLELWELLQQTLIWYLM